MHTKQERLRRKEMREAESQIVCRAIIWHDFVTLECAVPELMEKVTQELIDAVHASRVLAWRQKRERMEET